MSISRRDARLTPTSRNADAASSPEIPCSTLEGPSVSSRFTRHDFSKIGVAGVAANTLWKNCKLPRHCASDRLTQSRPCCCRCLRGQSGRPRHPLSPYRPQRRIDFRLPVGSRSKAHIASTRGASRNSKDPTPFLAYRQSHATRHFLLATGEARSQQVVSILTRSHPRRGYCPFMRLRFTTSSPA